MSAMKQQLRKTDATTNVINWFEIPVTDTPRAKQFYETLLDLQMETLHFPESGETLTFFPFNPDIVQATSGRVTGVLTQSPTARPSLAGTLVYLNASPSIQAVLDRVVPAGGAIISGPVYIKAGFIAIISDTEGNRIGLHAEA